jgi:hypothetical protein
MASFAKIGSGNIVEQVVAVSNEVATTEQAGVEFLQNLYNDTATWKQTSYNTYGGVHSLDGTPFRKNFAGVGYTYDETKNAFIAPKPYASWVLDDDTCLWEAPVVYPDDDKEYEWNEDTTSWDAV